MFATLQTYFRRATIAPHETPNRKRKVVRLTQHQGTLMRDARAIDGNEERVGFTFSFQIADGGKRRACCVRVDAANFHDASALFRERWPAIEEVARDSIRAANAGDGVIALELPSPAA